MEWRQAWRWRQAMAKWRWGRRKWRGAPHRAPQGPAPVQVQRHRQSMGTPSSWERHNIKWERHNIKWKRRGGVGWGVPEQFKKTLEYTKALCLVLEASLSVFVKIASRHETNMN